MARVLRMGIDSVTRVAAWLRRTQRIESPHVSGVKVNLWSGLVVAGDWIHIDNSLDALIAHASAIVQRRLYPLTNVRAWYGREEYVRLLRERRFVHHALEYGIPFADESIDYIYSSHVLEHLERRAADRLLSDAYRALKVGGVIRICVPDLGRAIEMYQQGKKTEALSLFFEEGATGTFSMHRWMYDFELLRDALVATGFETIVECGYQECRVPDLEVLDNRPEKTLYVEASKS